MVRSSPEDICPPGKDVPSVDQCGAGSGMFAKSEVMYDRGMTAVKGHSEQPDRRDDDPLETWYRRAIEKIESLPENQNGSDKSWVFVAIKESELHFSRARRE